MSHDILGSVRRAVRETPAYPFEPGERAIKLDQNESPHDFPAELKEEALRRAAAREWNRYPDLTAEGLRTKIAAFEDWDPQGVVLTPGSNVLIKVLIEAGGIGQRLLTASPGFAVYNLEARMLESQLTEVPLEMGDQGFATPVAGLLEELGRGGPGLFALLDPHAPTGTVTPDGDIARLLDAADAAGWLSVVDEAYGGFAGTDHRGHVRGHAARLSLRTFSKTWGLAGVRLGYALTSPELATELRKLVPAFNINVLSESVIEVALERPEYMAAAVQEARRERERMMAALREQTHWEPLPSRANFFLLRTPDPVAAAQALKNRGIRVRPQHTLPLLAGCLRVSVGSPAENDAFLAAAREIAPR